MEPVIIHLSSKKPEDLDFLVEVFSESALKLGWARENDRIYILDNALNDAEIKKIFETPAPKSILDMPLPPMPKDNILTQHLFTMPDGTEVTWIKHPSVLPEEAQKHWRDHLLHFQFINKELNYEAHHSVHRLVALEGYDGAPRFFAPGGIRWVDYADRASMISDALDMSLAVTMKIESVQNHVAGSKVALIADKANMKEVFASLYKAIARMGLAITGADLGLSDDQLETYIEPVAPTTCVSVGVYRDGIPCSIITADGVYEGLLAMIDSLPGKPKYDDVTVSIQGLGEVGYLLAGHLLAQKVSVVIAEVNQDSIAKFKKEFAPYFESGKATILDDPSSIYDAKADIFSPCALRGILNESTLPRLKKAGVKMIGGPANNTFSDQVTGPWLFQNEGISVIPYEGIGAGGVVGVAYSIMTGFFGSCPYKNEDKVKILRRYVEKVIQYAAQYNIPAQVVSDRILINGINRRTLLDRDKAYSFMDKLAEAFSIGGDYERLFVQNWTKEGFFAGKGRFPEGGWKHYPEKR